MSLKIWPIFPSSIDETLRNCTVSSSHNTWPVSEAYQIVSEIARVIGIMHIIKMNQCLYSDQKNLKKLHY